MKKMKYKGSLKLAAIGDALGWMTEFERNKENIKNKFGTEHINSFHNWKKNVGGRFYGYVDKINSGSYSDDTQLLLSVARSINTDGFVNNHYFSKKELPNWLLYSRGAGRTVKNAARKIKRKSAKWNCNFFTFKIKEKIIDYRESGANGAAMRILPIALANYGNHEKIKKEIFSNSIITHGHPRAILGAMLYGYAINLILKIDPNNFNFKFFLTELGKEMHNKFSIEFLEDPKLKYWENEWNKNSRMVFRNLFKSIIDETQEYLRKIYKSISKQLSDFDTLTQIGCYRNETKGSGTSTVIAGIYFTCKYYSNPIIGIEKAVNSIGTDSDSIAAFTGGLIGALHGEAIIPSNWKNVQDHDYIEKISINLLEISKNKKEYKKEYPINKLKSLANINGDYFKINEKVFLETLGEGEIIAIDRQKTLSKGKYNLILDVQFKIGQICRFNKLLNLDDKNTPKPTLF